MGILSGADWVSLIATPSSTTWGLAKIVLSSAVGHISQFFHTACHLVGESTTAAFTRSVRRSSSLGTLVDPFTIATVSKFFDMMLFLHNDHDALWSGNVFDLNITEVRRVVVDIARFFLDAPLHEILGCSAPQHGATPVCPTSWWAGGAANFVESIVGFARDVEEEAVDRKTSSAFAEEFVNVGLVDGSFQEKLRKKGGFSMFFAHMVFVQSVYHTTFFFNREFSGVLGVPHTKHLGDYFLSNGTDHLTLAEVIDQAFPQLTPAMVTYSGLMTSTGIGYGRPAELGDGPFDDTPNKITESINDFRANLVLVREGILETFPPSDSPRFLPKFFYPKEVSKPYGYGLLQTVFM